MNTLTNIQQHTTATGAYLITLAALNYSQKTIKTYQQGIDSCAAYMMENYIGTSWRAVTPDMTQGWVNWMVRKEYERKTIETYLTAVRTMYTYWMQTGLHNENPCRNIRLPRTHRNTRTDITERAINQALTSSNISAETKAAIAILWETGIRIGELEAMTTADIDRQQQRIKIHGKGRNERYVYYGHLTKSYGNLIGHKNGRLFTREDRSLRYNIHIALRFNGGGEYASPHRIRHAFATTRIANGMPIETLSALMGHQNVATTTLYIHLTDEQLQQQANKYL